MTLRFFVEATAYSYKLLMRLLQYFGPNKIRVVEILKRVIVSYRRDGFRKSFMNFMKMIRRSLTQIATIRIVYKVDLNGIRFVPENKGFTIEEANLYDLDLMNSINEKEVSPDRYQYLRGILKSSSSSCYLLKNSDGDMCGYCCLAFGKVSHAKIFSKIQDIDTDKNGYLFRDYTFKKFRNRGVHTFGIYSRLLILKNKGYKTATTRVARGNIAAEHAYKNLGFRGSLIELHFHFFSRFPNSNFLLIPLHN